MGEGRGAGATARSALPHSIALATMFDVQSAQAGSSASDLSLAPRLPPVEALTSMGNQCWRVPLPVPALGRCCHCRWDGGGKPREGGREWGGGVRGAVVTIVGKNEVYKKVKAN